MKLSKKLKNKVRRFTDNSNESYYIFNTVDGKSIYRGMFLKGDHHKKITGFSGDYIYDIEEDEFEKIN